MKHLRITLAAGILAAGLAACGDSQTELLRPEGPRMNGYTFGSGHRSSSDSTSAATSGETTADGTVQRAGYTYGSGH